MSEVHQDRHNVIDFPDIYTRQRKRVEPPIPENMMLLVTGSIWGAILSLIGLTLSAFNR